VFGWKIVKSPPMGNMDYWLIETVPVDDKGRLMRPGVNGGMYIISGDQRPPVNYVRVDNINKAFREAKRLGATVINEKTEIPNIGVFAVLKDPEGNPIAMMQPATMM